VGTAPNTGCITTGIGTSLSYSGGTLLPGVTGNIQDLTIGGGTVDNFMTFPTTPPLDFVLTAFVPQTANSVSCAAATVDGNTCIPVAGSPFLLTNLGTGNVGVSLEAIGYIVDAGVTSYWSGSFTTQLIAAGMTPLVVQTEIGQGQSISSTQSGTFILTTTPEPFTLPLIGGGLMVLAMIGKKRKTRA
jgi:hypothetical protein